MTTTERGRAYRDRTKPAATLMEWQRRETYGSLADTRERTHFWTYRLDVDGFLFKREHGDQYLTGVGRWQKVRSMNKPQTPEQVAAIAADMEQRMARNVQASKGDWVKTIHDNRQPVVQNSEARRAAFHLEHRKGDR